MNSKKKMETNSKDFISNLPDALICHILSYLSTKDAALTSILSKRWRLLLAFVPNLEFDNMIYDHPKMGRGEKPHLHKSFKLFVDKVMAMQGNAPLNKFSLRCKIGPNPSRVNGWILKALERGVVELDLYISSEYDYPLPPQVLMSKTLVKLKVVGTDEFTIDVKEVYLPKLKTLHMDDVAFIDEKGGAFAKLVSSCHTLEELVMIKVMWEHWESCSVSNPTLKRVTIYWEDISENPKRVLFDTPNLVYLEYTDAVAFKYPKMNFDSLIEASVALRMSSNQLFKARDAVNSGRYSYKLKKVNAADFLVGISNVKILYLSTDTLEVLAFCCTEVPIFNNLIHLTIETGEEVEWEGLPNLLEKCPNLETLIFEGLHYRDTNQCWDASYRFKETNKCFDDQGDRCVCKPWYDTPIWLSSSPVKVLKVLKFGEISNYSDDMDKQMDLIKYFVETMPNLEQVILYYDTPIDDDDVSNVLMGFQMLEKVASSKCKIQVISDNISFSTAVHSSSSSTNGLVFFKNAFPV